MRIVVRNEEWLIRRVDPSSDGGHVLRCDGLSELVSGKEALFLTQLEWPIKVLAPEYTQLVPDTSDKYGAAVLFLESQRRRSIPNDKHIHLGHRGVMNNVAARASETGMSRRARLARLLATRSDTLMLLSATPHDGSARSFASLMSLLDPTAISDPDDYTPEDFKHKGLVVRRFKKDIRDQGGGGGFSGAHH